MRVSWLSAAIVGFALGVSSGCLASPVSVADSDLPEGEIVFSYTGELAGHFRARGIVHNELPNSVRYGTWSAAFYQPSSDRTRLLGFQALSEPHGRIVEIRLGRLEGRTVIDIDPELCATSDPMCPALVFDPQGTNESLQRGVWSPSTYRAVRGRIEFEDITTGRMRGRFSGTLARQGETEARLEISDGRFDVPVLYPDLRD